jgi:insertion element IS1 protein InsB
MLFFRGKYALLNRMGRIRSFVGSKKNQRWTWYIVERKSGIIIAWENGR